MAFKLVNHDNDKKNMVEYSMVLNDGTGVTEAETFYHEYEEENGLASKIAEEVLRKMMDLQSEKKMDVSEYAVILYQVADVIGEIGSCR